MGEWEAEQFLSDHEEPVCERCGKEIYDHSDYGCERCDARVRAMEHLDYDE